MLGALVGDIVGSRFEFNNHRSKEFSLFAAGCFATDDSIMTLAVAKAIMAATKSKPQKYGVHGETEWYNDVSKLTKYYMRALGRQYPNCGFGGRFYKWVFSDNPMPYNSFGNGAAMRVSPAGFAATSRREAIDLSAAVTAVTHDHQEGLKGAEATAVAIFLARSGSTRGEIREAIERDYYSLDFRIDDIRPTYHFNETCQETVPQAIECFLESTSFEDAIRTAISLGGDSDTIAAITGAIAEAYYGVPAEIAVMALTFLDDELREIYGEWVSFRPPSHERFRLLTKYIGMLSDRTTIGDLSLKTMDYRPLSDFVSEWDNSPFRQFRYGEVLTDMGVDLSFEHISGACVAELTSEQVLALITAAFRHNRFVNGMLVEYISSGAMLKWLRRLKEIDRL